MSWDVPARRRRSHTAVVVLAAAAAAVAVDACTAPVPSGPEARPSPSAVTAMPTVTAELNQFRDTYGKGIIEIQLNNATPSPVTVLAARIDSPLFPAGTAWQSAAGGTAVPPGQTKSFPAPLPAARCGPVADADAVKATISVAAGSGSGQQEIPVTDPYGILRRNNAELCLAQDAAAVALIRLEPDLDVSPDGGTAVVRLTVVPQPSADTLIIDRVEGTTLLAESVDDPWPNHVAVAGGGPPMELRLRIRPARCDPHAVAEDKVGTLLPLQVTVGNRQGVLKVDAGPVLRGRIYDFVTAACLPH
ncbi:hypothetical protein [Arthrobacter sp. 92]|uniref:hypothetical protein n=1 Tax=Arthrobacter sp. 92 TaxID=3418175 RepID=UPI003D07EF67